MILTQFVRLDDIFDSSVDTTVKLLIQRGGKDMEVEVFVEDLHAITSDLFVSVAGANFYDLSYQQARLNSVACKGVFICEALRSFNIEGDGSGWIIQSVDHKQTPDLKTFIGVIKVIPDRAGVVVEFNHLSNLHTSNTCPPYQQIYEAGQPM